MGIINAIIHYGSIIMTVLLGLVALTTMTVEVVKRLVPKVPTDLMVFIIAIAVSGLTLAIAAAIMNITIMWYYAVGAVVLGIAVAYAAMFGWDKFTALWSRFRDHITGTAEDE